ncbi:MAG: hypothetical protein ACKO38_06305, partial [Planctomycetota bacterium]
MLSLPPLRLGERTACLPLSPLGSIDLANLWLSAGAGEADVRGGWERLLVHEPALALWAALAAAASPIPRCATHEQDVAPDASSASVRHPAVPAIAAATFLTPASRPADSRPADSCSADSRSADEIELDRVSLAAIAERCLLPAFQAVAARPAAVECAADNKGDSDEVVNRTTGAGPDAALAVAARAAFDTVFDPTAWADGLWAIRAARRGLRADLAGLVGEAWTAEWLGDAGEWLERALAGDDSSDAADSVRPAHRRRLSINEAAGSHL